MQNLSHVFKSEHPCGQLSLDYDARRRGDHKLDSRLPEAEKWTVLTRYIPYCPNSAPTAYLVHLRCGKHQTKIYTSTWEPGVNALFTATLFIKTSNLIETAPKISWSVPKHWKLKITFAGWCNKCLSTAGKMGQCCNAEHFFPHLFTQPNMFY